MASTVNVRSKFWRLWKKRDFSKVWFFVWSYETKTAFFKFDIPAEKFFAKHGKCSFKVLKNWKKKRTSRSLNFWLNFWDEDCSFQIWYPCWKLFRQALWMFVQKSEEFEKTSELSEVWFFDWSFETKTAIINFDIPAEMFFAKHGERSFKNLKCLKKIRTLGNCFFTKKCSFGHVECSFIKQVKIFLPRFKKSLSSSYVTSNTNISKRIHIAK